MRHGKEYETGEGVDGLPSSDLRGPLHGVRIKQSESSAGLATTHAKNDVHKET